MRLSQDVVDLIRNPESPDGLIRDALLDMGADVASVYVVSGETGEYSDQSGWTVAAFLDRAQADAFCEMLNQWCRDRGAYMDDNGASWEARNRLQCPHDPNFHCDYTGTKYAVEAVPLRLA